MLWNRCACRLDNFFIFIILPDLLKNIRTEVLIALIKPYTRIGIDFIAQELNISVEEVENLTVASILDGLAANAINNEGTKRNEKGEEEEGGRRKKDGRRRRKKKCVCARAHALLCIGASKLSSPSNFYLHPSPLLRVIYRSVHGRIDQVNRLLLLDRVADAGDKYNAINKWVSQIDRIYQSVVLQSTS